MKNRIFAIAIAFASVVAGCRQPEPIAPTEVKQGLNSISVRFAEGQLAADPQAVFTAEIGSSTTDVVVSIPWFYPRNSDNVLSDEMLKNMRVTGNIDANCYIEPALGTWDLSEGKSHTITVTNNDGTKKIYTISASIDKLTDCIVSSCAMTAPASVTGMVDNEAKTITFYSVEDMSASVLSMTVSPHAAVSPDPATARNYENSDQTFTITAHDGVTQAVYTVLKRAPLKLPVGLRVGSGKLLWAAQGAAAGNASANTTSFAISGDYLLVNTRAADPVKLNRWTGTSAGTLDLPSAIKGNLRNFFITNDYDGNMLLCNLASNDGTFKVWFIDKSLPPVSSISTTPYIDWSASGSTAIGRKISITGSLESDAVIMAPVYSGGNYSIARWQVTGGTLQSETPTIVSVTDMPSGSAAWTQSADAVSTSSISLSADYFVAGQGSQSQPNCVFWVDGATNKVKASLSNPNVGAACTFNPIDYIEFNNSKFIGYTTAGNGYNGPDANCAWVTEIGLPSGFAGLPNNVSILKTASYYAAGNGNGTGDILFKASDDGFFLYVYFMFSNGYVVCYQMDCVDDSN
ncbi:MAG: DUF5018 domain-containing protein [Rikenellaceae bacterium]|jgi:hypothetical protein|nr:DUF5018 domain-containing protein [Rikenellaceae bacterium]